MPEAIRCPKCGAPVSDEVAGGFCTACLLEEGLSPAELEKSPFALKYFGDYELIEEIARGGMGVVFKARQRGLNRLVAVKMILSGHLASGAEAQRFRAEARAAAALQHPGIVAIHEVGEHEGLLYFSMDYVEGQNLAQVVRDGPLSAQRAAECVREIAEAIHYAHEHGVLHRDLKPSNVLIDGLGKPHVTDFGLAKQLDHSELEGRTAELTVSGQVLGSPNFMPPEQAAGKHRELTPASDVYSLGALLYHLLTGRPPFLADSVPATLRLVMETEPAPPRLLTPTVPRDLETICLKCLQKEPRRRYATAQEFADELGRFLRDEPIRARPIGPWEKLHRWARRHPVIAALTGIIGLLLIAIAAISTVAAARLQRANHEGQEKLREAYLSQAKANRWSGRPGRRFESLKALRQAAEIRPGTDLRNEAIAAMALVDVRPLKQWAVDHYHHGYQGFDATFERYLRADTNGTIHVHRTSDDYELLNWPGESLPITQATFSPDGRTLAAVWEDQGFSTMRAYDFKRKTIIPIALSDRWMRGFCFSANAHKLAVATWTKERNSTITFYDTTNWQPHVAFTNKPMPYGMALDPTGALLAVASLESDKVEILDAFSGSLVTELAHSKGVHTVVWSSTGRTIATGCEDKSIYVWDMSQTPPHLTRLANGAVPPGLCFKGDDELLVSSDWGGWAKIWDLKSRKELMRWPVVALGDFSYTDPRRVSCYSSWDSYKLFEIARGEECRVLPFSSATGGSYSVNYSPDGRLLVSAHEDGLRIWDAMEPHEPVFIPHRGIGYVQFARDGSGFISVSLSEFLWWPLQSTVRDGTNFIRIGLPAQLGRETAPPVFATNRLAAAVNGKVYVIDAQSQRIERRLTAPKGFYSAALSPDGNQCATWKLGASEVEIWDANDGSRLQVVAAPNAADFCFSPDGRWLVTGSGDEDIFWETKSWRKQHSFARGGGRAAHVRIGFSADSKTVALPVAGNRVQLLDTGTLTPLASLESPESDFVSSMVFSPDGSRVAVSSGGRELRIWNLPRIRQRLTEMNLDWDAPALSKAATSARPLRITVDREEDSRAAAALGPVVFSERDSRCTTNQIDLSQFYNASLTNSWFNPVWRENDLASLPQGLQTLDGVPFDVRGVVQLSCTHPDLSVSYPAEISDIPIRQKARSLHFLHSAGWYHADGADIGEYVIRYKDGASRSVPIVYAENIWSWWELPGKAIPEMAGTTVAWRGRNPFSERAGKDLLLFHFRWVNPRPDTAIVTITFRSRMTKAAPFLVAITTE